MSGTAANGSKELGTREGQLLELWAEITRAVALLPPTNHRLTDALERFLRALRALLDGNARVAILIHGNSALVGPVDLAVGEHLGVAWLQERLARTATAGVEFSGEITPQSFLTFSARLLEHWVNKDRTRTFADFWPEPFPGIRPIELRFDAREGGGDLRSLVDGGGRELSRVERLLRADAGFMAKVRALEKGLAGSGEGQLVDIVARIAATVPEEAADNEVKVLSLTRSVLSAIEQEIRALAQGGGDGIAGLGDLLNNVSRKYFFREEQGESPAAAAVPARPPERREPDLAALEQRILDLPARAGVGTQALRFDSDEEILDAQLYFLCRHVSDQVAERLRQQVVRSLSASGGASFPLVETYLTWARQEWDAQGDPRPIRRMVELLRASSRAIGINGAKFLSRDLVVQSFPELFLQYLDSVNLNDPGKAKELASICTELGAKRILGGRDALFSGGAFRGPGRANKILAVAHESFLPLVHLIIEDEGEDRRVDVLDFLRRLRLPHKEAVLCKIESPAVQPPVRYLSLLARHAKGGSFPAEMAELVAGTLCDFINAVAEDRNERPNRLYAISQLGGFPTPRARECLLSLAHSRKLLRHAEDRETRMAALTVLNALDRS